MQEQNVCDRLLLHENVRTLIPSDFGGSIKSSRILKLRLIVFVFYMSFVLWKDFFDGGCIRYHKPLALVSSESENQ